MFRRVVNSSAACQKSADVSADEDADAALDNWNYIEEFWPASTRSQRLQNRELVNALPLVELLTMFRFQNESKIKKDGESYDDYVMDNVLTTKTFKKADDDGYSTLNEDRFLRKP